MQTREEVCEVYASVLKRFPNADIPPVDACKDARGHLAACLQCILVIVVHVPHECDLLQTCRDLTLYPPEGQYGFERADHDDWWRDGYDGIPDPTLPFSSSDVQRDRIIAKAKELLDRSSDSDSFDWDEIMNGC